MMDSKSILQYFLSFFILLANVEINFGYFGKHDVSLEEVDCHYDWYAIVCTSHAKIEDQMARLKEHYRSTLIDELVLSNKHHYTYNHINVKGLQVRVLTIVRSNITSMEGPAFDGLEDTLKELSIVSCRTDKPNEVLFSLNHLSNMEKLHLTNNNIQSFPNGYFPYSSNVKVVEIYQNEITEIGSEAFANLNNLEQIDMSHNHIKMLKRSMFPNPALHMDNLVVRDNQIETIDSDCFENMPKLEHVDLYQNHLQMIDEATFKPIWSQLYSFNFDPISCEEDNIRWMVTAHEPRYIHVYCKGKKYVSLGEKIEKMRMEVW